MKLNTIMRFFYGAMLMMTLTFTCKAQESFESYPAGTRLTTQIAGVSFTDYAEVFAPVAVRATGSKAVRGCTGCTDLRISFSPTVGTVSLDVGMDAEACNNDQCFDTAARLQALDAAGNLIMSSAPLSLSRFADINQRLQVSDAAHRIAMVRIRYTNLGMAGRGRVSFDNLFFSASGGSSPRLGAPTISFSEPVDNALVLTSPWIRGHIDAPAGVLTMCVAVNRPLDVRTCGGETQNFVPPGTRASDFALAPLSLHPGTNTISVAVRDNLNQPAPLAQLRVRLASTATGIDFAPSNMLITQGVQERPPSGSGFFTLADGGGSGQRARYNGVSLARDAKTVVRFFANATSTGSLPPGTTLRPPARLFGFVDGGRAGTPLGPDRGERLGTPLPGSPLSPDAIPDGLSAPASFDTDVANASVGYQFTLPISWTQAGTILLQAEVNPQDLPGSIPEANRSNNGFQAEQVEFSPGHDPIRIYAVALTYTGAPGGFGNYSTVPDPWFAYDRFRHLVPMRVDVPGYRTIVDISSIINSGADFNTQSGQVLSLLGRYNNEGLSNQYVVGFTETSRQSSMPIQGLGQGFLWGHGVAYVAPSRPLTSVGHESFHLLGFNHAGGSCPGVQGSGGIDTWPAGDMGDILGNGLDVNNVLGPSGLRTRYRPIIDTASAPWFDFMSYCADPDEHNSWISTRNWNRLVGGPDINAALLENHVNEGNFSEMVGSDGLPSFAGLLVAADARAGTGTLQVMSSSTESPLHEPMLVPVPSNEPTLQVFAWVKEQKAMIWRIAGGKRKLTPPDRQSAYHFIVRDASGQIVSDTPAPAAEVHLHHDHSSKFFAVEIAAPRAELVQLVYRGQQCPVAQAVDPDCVLAERRRSSQAPVVKITGPTANSTLDTNKSVTISWAVSALAPNTQTFADLEYSVDDGNTWRAIAGNLTENSVSLPAHLFPASKTARLRLTFNDGFNEAVNVSERFTSPGAPPSVHIVDPVAQFAAPQGSAVYFSAEAYDDAGDRLSPKQLEWFDGKTPLSSGEKFSNSKLAPGMHTIELLARDNMGRTSVTTQTIDIIPLSGTGAEDLPNSESSPSGASLPSAAPTGSTILVPEQVFAGGVLTGVVIGPDDQPVANTPVQIASGAIPGDLSGEVIGEQPNEPAQSEKPGTQDTNKQPGLLANCVQSLKGVPQLQGNLLNGVASGGSPTGKTDTTADAGKVSSAGQTAKTVFTDAQGRFALCVLPDAAKLAVNLPGLPGEVAKHPGGVNVEATVIQDEAAYPTPQPPFKQPLDFVQPGEKFTLPGNFPKGGYEQNGLKGNLPVATAISADGNKSVSTFQTPRILKPGPIQFHFTDSKGKESSFAGGIFRIVSASLDRSQLHSNQGADFRYEVQVSPESVPDGLCVEIKLVGPIVMVQAPPAQVPLDLSGRGKFAGKIRATQVTPGSAVPFDIKTSFHSCNAPPR